MSSPNKPQASASAGDTITNTAQRLGALRSWRWRGSLQDLPHSPVEIQLKVYSHLHPQDLLALARTSKQFRAFFLHRSNEPLWHTARENAGNLPPCPPFMSEPAFMNLLFSPYCQNCGRSSGSKVIWEWFARYCPKCVIALSYSYNESRDKISHVDPHKTFSTPGALLELFGVYRNQRVDRLEDCTSHAFRLCKTHVDSFIQTLDQLAKPITDEARSQVIARQKAYTADRLPYVNSACKDWHDERQAERAARLEASRREHYTEIVKRLNEMGWDKEVELFQRSYSWEHLKIEGFQVVRQPSKLGPKSWEKTFEAIYPVLWPYRHKRLVQDCTAVFRPRFAALQAAIIAHYIQLPRTAQMDYHPNSVDLALMDECRAIADVPADKTVTQEDFAALVPELSARWEQERKKELTETFIAHLPAPPPDDVDVLGLGVAIFPCTRCKDVRKDSFMSDSPSPQYYAFYRYPVVLSHPCTHYGYDFKETHNKDLEVYPTLAAMRPTEEADATWYPFSLSRLCDERDLKTTMTYLLDIMDAMGLDPSRTTKEELEACPARLRCTWCESSRARYYAERNETPPLASSRFIRGRPHWIIPFTATFSIIATTTPNIGGNSPISLLLMNPKWCSR
ncbi:hypothetical protein C8Q74DRAFT_343132 [Fomes fomentarius]|nr:hypothetical protein C8Q74DRAFT_343132 [Fomes fomentarius]